MLVTLLLAGLLAGCSGGSDSGGSSRAEAPAEARDQGTTGQGGAAPQKERSTANGEEGGGDGSGSEGARGSDAKLPAARSRAVVYTSELRVRADDVEQAASRAKQLTTAAGGYVGRESAASSPPRAEVTLRVPADRYAELLARLSSELGEKLSLNQEAEDVTAEVADVESRVRSAEATLASFRKLLERAGSLDEIMRLEDEISERESDLEALQARHKALQESTSYATLTVTVVGKAAPREEPKEEQGGFIGGLKDGWDAFSSFVGGLAVILGWLLPFLIALAVLAVPVFLLRHRLRARVRAWSNPRGRLAPAGGPPSPGATPPGTSGPATSGPGSPQP
ncbi:DUF4349 domain-containing protein [Actinomadura algeriensis]|uniref:DUF4349 domain-containing protein n=1 Tax=Actinomadura algeriensis TaxID=1679523 RepID=A0ABR9K433_9ACTN|nr:DUF4349 domain-containing protein [Actinomadura algeriensis]MBE1537610.1 hypothetical protein [Actinomadura algeriensis]